MARMFPPDVPPRYPSQGEIEVFRQLRDDPGTADWVVLHSLFLAEPGRRAAGEVDFVVIIPGVGIVCLEVKGCSADHLRRENGLWFYGPGDSGDPRGPFRQATDAMHALRRRVLDAQPKFRNVLFAAGVVFPYAPFSETSVEWSDWQVIDSKALRKERLGTLVKAVADATRRHLSSLPNAPRLSGSGPTADECREMRDLLRGDFEVPIDVRARARSLEDELARYTAEQFFALDGMAENARTVFVGPAGTGKTLLALEAAKRSHAEGRRVLLICFNRLLGAWLEEGTKALKPGVSAGTLHRQMLTRSGLSQPPQGAGVDFWDTELPAIACERILSGLLPESDYLYDELIVDEAQDLLRPDYLDFLDISLRDGWGGGRWRMFGDFEKQAIYGASTLNLAEFLTRWAPGTPRFALRENCRNTPLTVSWVHYLAGLNPPYSRTRRPDDHVHPEIQFYKTSAEQSELLRATIERLQGSGLRARDIVILSKRGEGSCAATLAAGSWAARLAPLVRPKEDRVGYSTVHAFKGLEAPAIVITDLDSIEGDEAQALFYVAITRALQRLHILAHESVRGEFARILLGGGSNS